jgi:hypothetical protein
MLRTHGMDRIQSVLPQRTPRYIPFPCGFRGANGGVAGNDVLDIFKSNRTVDIKGIDNHRCTNIDIGTAVGGVIHTNKGLVSGIMNQYTVLNKGLSIHSPCQCEWYKNDINDKSILVPGGLQVYRL